MAGKKGEKPKRDLEFPLFVSQLALFQINAGRETFLICVRLHEEWISRGGQGFR